MKTALPPEEFPELLTFSAVTDPDLEMIVKVARLQSEFCTKDFFRATNFVTKNAPKFSPKFLSLCSVGPEKNPAKFPPNFPLNFPNLPAKNKKKIHRRASAGAQGDMIVDHHGYLWVRADQSKRL